MHRVKKNKKDIMYILDNLRDEDRIELESSHGENYKQEVLKNCINTDVTIVYDNDKPIMMYGIFPQELPNKSLGGYVKSYLGVVWLLTTNDVIKNQVQFLREGRNNLKNWSKDLNYKFFCNYAHVANSKAIRWLKWLGFKFDNPKPKGFERDNFIFFYKEVNNV